MKTIIQNETLHIALICGLLVLAITTDDPEKEALFKSFMIIAALNFIRILSNGANAVSDSNNDVKQ